MKYYVYHYRGKELEVPGVFQEGEASPIHRLPHFIDIEDVEFGNKIKELSKKYDVMISTDDFVGPLGSNKTSIFLDDKNVRFKQR